MQRGQAVRRRLTVVAAAAIGVVGALCLAVAVCALPSAPGRHARGLVEVIAAVLVVGVAAAHVRVLLRIWRNGSGQSAPEAAGFPTARLSSARSPRPSPSSAPRSASPEASPSRRTS